MDGHTQFNHKMDQSLIEHLLTLTESNDESVPVIIKIKNPQSPDKLHLLLSPAHDVIKYRYTNLPFISGQLSLETIRIISSLSEVEGLYLDRLLYAFCNKAKITMNADYIYKEHGLTGEGVTIAVLDTGIFPHPDFTNPVNRIKEFKDFVNGISQPYDDSGHGTHISGCIAGNGFASKGNYAGLAPKANLLGIKVLDKNGVGFMSSVMAGIDYCIQHQQKHNIRIINLSLGLAIQQEARHYDPLSVSAALAVESGIVVSTAVDNVSSGGTIISPAHHPFVIAAGAVNDRETSETSPVVSSIFTSVISNISGCNKPDFLFPGLSIAGPLSPNSILAKQLEPFVLNSDYISLSGSSIAAGFCSGTAALLLQAYPPLKPEAVQKYMRLAMVGANKGDCFNLKHLFSIKVKE
ncbi:S8 family serine peptidase [Fictibacillus enclensis]|nr:S8 family serine peptidase [Fictibacillus enclensis]